jgi:GNAT superfamily N-acetyltransferase
MTPEFRYAQPGDYASISRFFHHYWAKDYVYTRKPELFDWTFGRRSLWDQDSYSFAIIEDRGEIAGILGAIPFLFNNRGVTSRAVWLANLMVRPEYRRGVLPIKLLGMFRRSPYGVNAVAGINSRAVELYQRLRWQLMGPLPRSFAVCPFAFERMVRLLRMTFDKWEAGRAESLARFFITKDVSRVSAESCAELPLSWDTREWPQIASQTIGAARDAAYLTWRYLRHPSFEYRLQAIPEGSRTGLAVWRLETIRAVTSTGLEEVDRIGRLVEFLPVSQSNARDLWRRFWKDLVETDAIGADYYGCHGATRAWLRELGFMDTSAHPDGDKIPSRFQPLDGKVSSILTAIFGTTGTPNCFGSPDSLWYWTKSDGDQDRPN